MKTTFDLPDPLLRQAKALAAEQGRPLRDLVAEALHDKVAALEAATRPYGDQPRPPTLEVREESPAAWPTARPDGREALRAALVLRPDGTYINLLGIEDPAFFEALEDIRARPRPTRADQLFDEIE